MGSLPEAAPGTIWTCPMHPEIRRNGPGTCPICGMALEPLHNGTKHLEPLILLLPRPTFPAQYLILCDLPDALRLLVAHLNRRDFVAAGDAPRYLLTSGLYFL